MTKVLLRLSFFPRIFPTVNFTYFEEVIHTRSYKAVFFHFFILSNGIILQPLWHCRCKVMESLMKGFPNLHKNGGLIRGKEVCV